MITNGFTYIAVLLLLAATLVTLEKNTGWKFFKFIPAVVLLYLLSMVLVGVYFSKKGSSGKGGNGKKKKKTRK